MFDLKLPILDGFGFDEKHCNRLFEGDIFVFEKLILSYVKNIETFSTRLKFGCNKKPLLLLVSTDKQSKIPNLMGKILNIGINDEIVDTLCERTNNPIYYWNSYLTLICDYAVHVLSMDKKLFTDIYDNPTKVDDFKLLVKKYKDIILDTKIYEFPQNVYKQLTDFILAGQYSAFNSEALLYGTKNNVNLTTSIDVEPMLLSYKDHPLIKDSFIFDSEEDYSGIEFNNDNGLMLDYVVELYNIKKKLKDSLIKGKYEIKYFVVNNKVIIYGCYERI